jgi:hypothetical protein
VIDSFVAVSASEFEDDGFLATWQQRSLFNVVAMFLEN